MSPSGSSGIISALFRGEIRNDLLFPFPTLSSEEALNLKILNETLSDFLQTRVNPEKIEQSEVIDEATLQGLADIGIMAVPISEEYEGYRFSQFSWLKIIEVLGGLSLPLASQVGIATSMCSTILDTFGTDEHKKLALKSLALGDASVSFAFSEESSGSDLNAMQSRARLTEDGDFYILDGVKRYVLNADRCNYFLILAKTPVDVKGRLRERISVFLVPRNTHGVTVGARWKLMGMHGLALFPVTLKSVKIPRTYLIGNPGQGFSIAVHAFAHGRLAQAAACLGALKKLYNLTMSHALNRRQFGKSIVDFGLVHEKLVKLSIRIFAAESMLYLVSHLADQPDVDFSTEAAACKLFLSESLWECANDALQIAAAMGYQSNSPFERMVRDARAHLIINGTSEIMRLLIAFAGLKEETKASDNWQEIFSASLLNPMDSVKNLSQLAARLALQWVPMHALPEPGERLIESLVSTSSVLERDSELNAQARLIEHSFRLFNRGAPEILLQLRENPHSHQLQLQRVANMAVTLFAGLSAYSYYRQLLSIKGKKDSEAELTALNIFLAEMDKSITHIFDSLTDNCDELQRSLSSVLEKSEKYSLGLAKYDLLNGS